MTETSVSYRPMDYQRRFVRIEVEDAWGGAMYVVDIEKVACLSYEEVHTCIHMINHEQFMVPDDIDAVACALWPAVADYQETIEHEE